MIILTKPILNHVVTENRETMRVILPHHGRVFSATVSRACSSALCELTFFRGSELLLKVPRVENCFTETVQAAKIALLALASKAA